MLRYTLPLCMIALILFSPTLYAEDAKVVAVPKTSTTITIDGRLTETAWRASGKIESFEENTRSAPLKNQSRVFLVYDDKVLYIGFKASESDMAHIAKATTRHDASVWDDDALEIFLDTKGDRASFVQLIVNAIGTRYDGLGEDRYGFNPKWRAATALGANEWTAEIRIPFSELGTPTPRPGDGWLGNFCRDEQPAHELSCWNASLGSFSSTVRYGEIVFGSLADKARSDIARVRVSLVDLAETVGNQSSDIRQALSDALSYVGTAESRLRKASPVSESLYLEVRATLRRAEGSLARVRDLVRCRKLGNPEYLVWETSPWKHFTAPEDTSHVEKEVTRIEASVLAGQTESRALMVSNLTDETLSARILLEGFAPDAVEVLIPTFVRCADGRGFPDALVPPDPIGQITVPAGETRQIWMNVKGRKSGGYSGTITISPLTASKTDKSVQLAVDVVQPSVPVPEPLAFTWDYLGDAIERGLEKEYVQTMVDHGIRVFSISGLHYMPRPAADDKGDFLEPADWSKFERQVQLVWKPGRKLYINMDVWEKASERKIFNGVFDSPGWRIAFKKTVSDMAAELRKLGLSYDDYFVCPVDESIDERYVAIARLIREVDPRIRIIEDTIGQSIDELKAANEYTDWWTPHFRSLRSKDGNEGVEYLKSTGKPVGFYFYSEGANEKAQDSYSHYIWDFWYAYSQGLNGIFGYWTATQHYGNPWNRHQSTASYDPSLFYYGNGQVITGRRWEAWRRGIEDFALLTLCEKSGISKSAISEAIRPVLDSPTDPDPAAKAREKLLHLLAGK